MSGDRVRFQEHHACWIQRVDKELNVRDKFKTNQLAGTGTFYENGFFYDSPEGKKKPKSPEGAGTRAQEHIKKLEYAITQEQIRRKYAESKFINNN